jgi:PAS domain S-box-containing protein
MASRRSRPTSAVEQLFGKRLDELTSEREERGIDPIGPAYRLLFERAPLPYVVTDYDGTIRAANRAAAVMLKRPSELLEGKSLSTFVPLEHRAQFHEMLAGLPLLDRLRDWRTTLVPHAGAALDVALHASVLDCPWAGRDAIFWIVRPRTRAD